MSFYFREDLNRLTPEHLDRLTGQPVGPTCVAHGIEQGGCPLCDCELCLAGESPDDHGH